MGRTFSPAVTAAPVIVNPDESHDEMCPLYSRWSYDNPWDPDSEAFFKDAVYEAFVPPIPLEPITPVESSDGSSVDSSGRGSPSELPPVPGQVSPLDQDMELWFDPSSPSVNTPPADGFPPLPTPRRHSTSELRRGGTQPHFMSSAAFERFYTRQLNRMRGSNSQRFPAMAVDGETDVDASASLRPGVSVRTSEITPIQLPSSQPRTAVSVALQHPRLARPLTPPPTSTSATAAPIPTATPSAEETQPSPPPSVSPRIYNWAAAAHSAPESPTMPSRIRVTPARWPVY